MRRVLNSSLLSFLLLVSACASTTKNEHIIGSFYASHFRVRRPLGRAADPKATPGVVDYKSSVAPSQDFNCDELRSLYAGFSLSEVRKCINSLESGVSVRYQLELKDQPEWTLMGLREDDLEALSEVPPCIQATLTKIPVPREIFFIAKDESSGLSCYASRVGIDEDRLLGVKLPSEKRVLVVRYPLEVLPQDDSDVLRILGSWSLRPFLTKEDVEYHHFKASYVPEALCDRCFGQKKTWETVEEDFPRWP